MSLRLEVGKEVRVLLFGATGFIGTRLVRALAEREVELILVGRDQSGIAGLERVGRVEWVTAELMEPGIAGRLVGTCKPDVVFNLAAYGVNPADDDRKAAMRLNADLPMEIGEAVAGLPRSSWGGARFIHTGSALEYGSVRGDVTESTPLRPNTLYGETKAQGTTGLQGLARSTGGDWLIIARLFNVFGPGERPSRLWPTLVRAAGEAGRIHLSEGSQRRDFAMVDDVARALLLLAGTRPTTPVVHVASGRLYPVSTFVKTAARVLGIDPNRLGFGDLPLRAGEMVHGTVSVDSFRRLTGWELEADLQQMIVQALRAPTDLIA